MKRKSKADRKASLRKRQQKAMDERDSKSGSSVLNLTKSGKKKIEWYKTLTGAKRNELNILPYEVTQEYYKNMRTFSGSKTGAEIGDLDYKLEVAIHFGVGPGNERVLCLKEMFGLHCEICQARFDEMDKGDDQDEKLVKSLRPKWRVYYNILDEKEKDGDIVLWDISYHMFEKLMLEDIDENTEDGDEPIAVADLDDGVVVKFKGKEKTLGKNKFAEAQSFEYLERDPFEEDILDDVCPLDKMLVIPTVDQVTSLFLGLDDDDDSGSDEKEKEDKQPKNKRRRGSKAEEDKPKTARRRRTSKSDEKEPDPDLPYPDEGAESSGDDNPCPYGGTFGTDCNKLSECNEACPEDTFNDCADENDTLKEAAKKAAAEAAIGKDTKKRRRRR